MWREYGQVPAAAQIPPLHRPQRQQEPGPFDWLVPFIPPVLRVNRETRAALRRELEAALTVEALVSAAQSAASTLRAHWRPITLYAVVSALWLRALYWISQHAGEFTTAFVILSGFVALGVHLFAPGAASGADDELSAYSVFNRGGQRMLGSLSAEQFENEIRHREPQNGVLSDERVGSHRSDSEKDEDDEEMLLALKLSLQEKKREERRLRRTTRRR